MLRRIIRRAVRFAYLLGVETPITAPLAGHVAEVMGDAYPEVRTGLDQVQAVLDREETQFRRTLRNGLGILEAEMADLADEAPLSGHVAFTLHDTYGFPYEVTAEIAEDRGHPVERDAFDEDMAQQKAQSKAGGRRNKGADRDAALGAYQDLLADARSHRVHGPGGGELHRHGPRPGPHRRRRRARGVPRPHPLLRRVRRPGGRHRHPHRPVGHGRGPRHHRGGARPGPPPGPAQGRRPGGRRPGHRGHRRPSPGGHQAQPHRHPPAPLGPPRGARPPREAAGLPGRARPPALRLQPLRAGDGRADHPHRGPGQPGGAGERPCAPLRDLQGGGPGQGGHRLLRREVRRPGAGAGGRPPLRSSCAAAPTSPPPATSAR